MESSDRFSRYDATDASETTQNRIQADRLTDHLSSHHNHTGFGEYKPRLPIKTVDDIISEAGETVPWVIEDVCARGAVTELSGLAKKGGKTTFWCHAIAAGARGDDHAGFSTEPARYLDLTEQGGNFSEHLGESGLAQHLEHVSIVRFKDVATLTWETLIRNAGVDAEALGLDVLVVDTFAVFARLKSAEENDAGAVADRMRVLRLVAQQHNIAVVLIRHAGKDGTPRGSSAFEAESDICVTISRPEGNHAPSVRRITGIGRYGEWERNIELVEGGYVSHGTDSKVEFNKAVGFARSVLPKTREGAKRKQEMLAMRSASDEGFSDRTFGRALGYLVEAGEAGVKEIANQRGKSKVYWLVHKPPDASRRSYNGVFDHAHRTQTGFGENKPELDDHGHGVPIHFRQTSFPADADGANIEQ